jgi:hypothetical protein
MLSTHEGFTRPTSKMCLFALPFCFSGGGCGIEGSLILAAQRAPAWRLSNLRSFGGAFWPNGSGPPFAFLFVVNTILSSPFFKKVFLAAAWHTILTPDARGLSCVIACNV